MADITPKKRACIWAFHEHCQASTRDIAKLYNVSQSSVARIIKQFKETGSPKRKGKCGRKRKTTARNDAYLLRKSKLDPRKTSSDLQKDLSTAGVEISASLVRRRLVFGGRRATRPQKKQLLTVHMKKKRLAWAKKYRKWTTADWKKVLFSDESHFMVQGQQSRFVRRSKGEEIRSCHINQGVKHPLKKMFWGSFSFKGIGSLFPVQGMMNADKYIKVIQRKVVKDMERAFPNGGGIFQQDLAPCHTAKKVKKFFEENHIKVLDWPGNSPDLNPIENLWSIVKNRLLKRDCTTQMKLINAIIDVWYHDQKITQNCEKLVESMPKRVKKLITNRGGHISY